ncbi:hypothetical protein BFJ70_g17197 [Fusarium oxysporum]|nr:hypothetical protein BFJ70_g17197 [Fusarium oxysporum]
MGRRAVTNPNKIESERERARNRRFLKRQMQQTLVREEYSGHSGVRMVDPTRNLVLVGDASRHHVGPDMNIISPSTHQVSIPISTPVSTAHGSVIPAPGLDNRASCCPTICDAIDPEVIPSSTGQLIDIQNGTQQAAAPENADAGSSSVEPQDSLGDDATLTAAQPRNETLQSFIDYIRQGNTGWTPEFLDPYKRAYDQIFKVFYSSKCNCTRRVEGDEAGLADSLRERVEQLRQFIPPLSTAFGETGSYDPSSSFQQWKSFLADEPSQPLSFSKSSQAFCHAGQPALSLSRQWDIDSIWFGAKGLQAIQSPNSFRLSFLPSAALNISKAEIIQPHGLDLARTRHIKLGTFNAHSVPFSAFVFFPNAAKDMTSSTQNALSLERQQDLYDHVIIPAAFGTYAYHVR